MFDCFFRRFSNLVRILSVAFGVCILCASVSVAQSIQKRRLVAAAVDENNLTVLRGNTYPLARADFDRGPAPPSLMLLRMLLVLKRSPEEEDTLEALLDQQQDKSSLNYHAWLTPRQFGEQFGAAEQDIQTITEWLASHGFQVNRVANGRTIIEFSGTAAQLKDAFRAEIHKYEVNGKERWANSTDPEIPSALTPLVAGIVSLHNFPRKPLHRLLGAFSQGKGAEHSHLFRPQISGGPLFTGGANCGLLLGSCYALAPYDFATIYNVLPLWNATPAIDGTGQTIAIVGQSDIYIHDVADFRTDFGLPPPNLNIINNGPDPGKLATEGDEAESDLDVQWSGAIAKGATIDFVVSGSTNSSAGVDLSAEYIVDNDIAPVMSESYGACELDLGTAGNQFYYQLWQQAAAEGITVFVSTGDSGSAVCDRGSESATRGLSVNGISSTPYNIAVGGTDFNDLQNPTTYWNTTNNSVTFASAKGYIPETAWNDSCTNSEFFQFTGAANAESDCNDSTSPLWPFFLAPIGGSGGASNCTVSMNQSVSTCSGGYAKPGWQTGVGVPNDGKRDVPDISMFAGDGLNANFYVICESDIYGGCANDPFGVIGIGGTSAPTPALAGIMALVNQKTQSRQGNANYVFYPLAAQPGASCNSSGAVGPSCIFYDVTTGTVAMSCVTGSPNCVTNVSGNQNGVLSGYSTTAGYDLATGLGSVNVSNLVNNWSSVSFQPTLSTLTLNPTTSITHGSSVNLNIAVTPKTGTGTPTGLVSLLSSAGPEAGTFTLANGSVAATTRLLPGGSYSVTAHYAGDGKYAASDSSPGIPVTVTAEPSITTVQAFSIDQNGNSIPFTTGPYGGTVVYLRSNVAGQSGQGVPTGTVNLTETSNGTTTNLAGDPFPLNSEGYTMTPLPGAYYLFLTPGAYSVAGSYSGDASINPSTSSAVSFTINKAQTSTVTRINECITANGPCVLSLGSNVTIFASVYSDSISPTLPTGTMIFYSNGTQLGPPVDVGPGIVPPNAFLSTNQLPLGSNNITAQFSGNGNYTGSTTSSPSTVNMIIFTTAALTASHTSIQVGQDVTFTAQVMPRQAGGPMLTGNVQFSSNGSNIGGPVNLSGGQAQVTTNSLPVGADQISATYSGDIYYGSTADTLLETVLPATPSFTVIANPTTISVTAPGQSGTTTLTISSQNGFSSNGPTTPKPICSNLPPQTTCSIDSFSLPANGTTTAALHFSTKGPSLADLNKHDRGIFSGWRTTTGELALAIPICIWIAAFGLRRTPYKQHTVLALIVLAFIVFGAACGGGGGGGGGSSGTPPGNYPGISVSITINGVTQTIQNLTLNVGQ
ncbi:MAG: Ig-like domain repeat protein [Candidatus Acidiferrales bacterium]